MSGPRLEVRLDRIGHNARTLVGRLGARGISICGVTKATLGSPRVARELLTAGVSSIGESRIENVERLRQHGVTAEILLVRTPLPSQVDRVVAAANSSLNSELDVIDRLSTSAQRAGRVHGVVVMVELGDLREGIMPGELHAAVRRILDFPGIVVRGIGTNLACQNGVIPDATNMGELSALATSIEAALGVRLDIVSGGNSANLGWALDRGTHIGRINHLRLGESLLLGVEPIRRTPIDGLRTDAISVVGEIIESKVKPSQPRGAVGQTAFGEPVARPGASTTSRRVIVALGRQDTDPDGLTPPPDHRILGAGSDHLVVEVRTNLPRVGTEVRFGTNYSAVMRAMASPFVTTDYVEAAAAIALAPVDVAPAAAAPAAVVARETAPEAAPALVCEVCLREVSARDAVFAHRNLSGTGDIADGPAWSAATPCHPRCRPGLLQNPYWEICAAVG